MLFFSVAGGRRRWEGVARRGGRGLPATRGLPSPGRDAGEDASYRRRPQVGPHHTRDSIFDGAQHEPNTDPGG